MKHSPSSSGDFGLFVVCWTSGLMTCFGLCWLEAELWLLSSVAASHWRFVYSTPQRTDFSFSFFFFFNSLHGLFGSSSSALRWPEFCWDVEFIVAVEITSELQKAERAQYRLSALASGRVTSLSVMEHRTERLPPVKEKRRMFSSGNKVENDFLWGWSVSCLGGLLFCRGVAAVGRTHFLCWHDEPGNSIITELWII